MDLIGKWIMGIEFGNQIGKKSISNWVSNHLIGVFGLVISSKIVHWWRIISQYSIYDNSVIIWLLSNHLISIWASKWVSSQLISNQ